MKRFSSYTELKNSPSDYEMLSQVLQLKPDSWELDKHPWLLSPAQWETLGKRCFCYENLKNIPLSQIFKNFSYELKSIEVDGNIYTIPTGAIQGWLQGMFMYITFEGVINT